MDSRGNMPSPWTVQQPVAQWGRHGGMGGYDGTEYDNRCPWVFYDGNTKERKAVIYSTGLCQRENISVV